MRIRATFVVCIALCTIAFAQDWKQVRKADETKWAKATGLDPSTIHKLWRQASHFPNEKDDDSRIADVDTEGLADHHHVLFVTYAGERNCLTLTVFVQYSETAFSKLWSVDKDPAGQGFCDNDSGSAGADVVNHAIRIRVPQLPSAANDYANYKIYDYEWNGITYRVTGQRDEHGQ